MQNEVSWGDGYAVFRDTAERIVGSVLQIIEATGLQKGQEEAVKEIIKAKIYSVWGENSIYISDDLFNAIMKGKQKVTAIANEKNHHVSWVTLEDIK